MKTLKEWEESDLDLEEYLGNEPCEIDGELELHIGEVVAPSYMNGGFTQMGEATDELDGVFTYITTSNFNGKFFFLGVLPSFKIDS